MFEKSDQMHSIINECMLREELVGLIEIEVQISWETQYAHHQNVIKWTFNIKIEFGTITHELPDDQKKYPKGKCRNRKQQYRRITKN